MTSKSKRLNGAVLAGGKSLRMGQDKGAMLWHGVEQREYIATLLSKFCGEVFISCRDEQQVVSSAYPLLPDVYENMGPLGAILTAFKKDPESAWLILACDLPLLDEATLRHLVEHRNENAIATTYESPYDGLPEPLITIWEPAAYPYLIGAIDEGYKCPRKALMRSEHVTVLKAADPDALMNTNTPEDAEKVRDILSKTSVKE